MNLLQFPSNTDPSTAQQAMPSAVPGPLSEPVLLPFGAFCGHLELRTALNPEVCLDVSGEEVESDGALEEGLSDEGGEEEEPIAADPLSRANGCLSTPLPSIRLARSAQTTPCVENRSSEASEETVSEVAIAGMSDLGASVASERAAEAESDSDSLLKFGSSREEPSVESKTHRRFKAGSADVACEMPAALLGFREESASIPASNEGEEMPESVRSESFQAERQKFPMTPRRDAEAAVTGSSAIRGFEARQVLAKYRSASGVEPVENRSPDGGRDLIEFPISPGLKNRGRLESEVAHNLTFRHPPETSRIPDKLESSKAEISSEHQDAVSEKSDFDKKFNSEVIDNKELKKSINVGGISGAKEMEMFDMPKASTPQTGASISISPMEGVTLVQAKGPETTATVASSVSNLLELTDQYATRLAERSSGRFEMEWGSEGDARVRVQLNMVEGQLRVVIRTSSPELGNYLRGEWSQFVQDRPSTPLRDTSVDFVNDHSGDRHDHREDRQEPCFTTEEAEHLRQIRARRARFPFRPPSSAWNTIA